MIKNRYLITKHLSFKKFSVKGVNEKSILCLHLRACKGGSGVIQKKWSIRYPLVEDYLTLDTESCSAYYKYPYQHWLRIKMTKVEENAFQFLRQKVEINGKPELAEECIRK